MAHLDLSALNTQRARLAKAFDIVSNPNDWRAPIDTRCERKLWARVLEMVGVTEAEVLESVEFFTATAATLTLEGDEVRITALGYRQGPAGC